MILQAERAWGKHPGWFDGLGADQQAQVLGLAFAEAGLSDDDEPETKGGRRGSL